MGASVTLDRAQREAIREEVRTAAGDCGDISRCLEDGHCDREFVVQKIAQLLQLVVVLDWIGWAAPENAQDDVVADVSPQIARWADGAAVDLELSLAVGTPVDWDRFGDALGALRLIAKTF